MFIIVDHLWMKCIFIFLYFFRDIQAIVYCTKGNTSNLSGTGCNLQNGAVGLGVDGGELLELHGGGSGQGQQGKQQDNRQLLHLDPVAWA